MTQREALITIIDFVREHPSDDKRIARALKKLEERAEILRIRTETPPTPPGLSALPSQHQRHSLLAMLARLVAPGTP